jgi:hypothetical protein
LDDPVICVSSRALVRRLFRNAQPADLDVLQERSSIASAEFSPSLPHCGHRMVITAVAPGAESNELEDVIHGVQYGATLTRTIRRAPGLISSPRAACLGIPAVVPSHTSLSKDTCSHLNRNSRYREQKFDAAVI